MNIDDVIKVCVMGYEYVGKTSLCNAICGIQISSGYTPTIGIDCVVKYIHINNDYIKIFMWDLSGQSRFDNVVKLYAKSGDVLMFCYSCEDYKSFLKMIYTHDNVVRSNNKYIVIVATKIDSKNCRPNYAKWGKEYADLHDYLFVKTSSTTTHGIDNLIHIIINIYKSYHPTNTDIENRCIIE